MVNQHNIMVFILGLIIGVLWMVVLGRSSGKTTTIKKSNKKSVNKNDEFELFQFRYLKRSLHDVVSRLHGIIGLSNLWLSKKSDINTDETMKTIYESASKINDILTEHLDLERNSVEENHKPVDNNRLKTIKILLVDDDSVSRMIIEAQLKNINLKPELAKNGEEALQKAKDQFFDIILMDIQMPKINGMMTTKSIREFEKGKQKSKIIAMTAHTREGYREKCLAAGMDDFLGKPVSPDELRNVLFKWLPINSVTPKNNKNTYNADSSKASFGTYLDTQTVDELKEITSEADAGALKDIYDAFLATLPQNILFLKTACTRGDCDLAKRISHTIKGSSASVGAKKVNQIAVQFEEISNTGELSTIQNRISELEEAFMCTREEIEIIFTPVNSNAS